MKRCPECRRDYYDETLLYCLDDGAHLLEGPASGDEPATAILHSTADPGESSTRAQIHTTEQTAVPTDPKEGPVTASTSRKNSMIAGVIGVLLLTGLGIGGYWLYGRGGAKQIESIAVLPFVNASGDQETDFLSDGMTETLISSLSQLANLNVKPRSSVFRYKGKETNPQAIGKELNVQAILNGRVVQRGQDLSLFVELIDVALDKVIWSQQYNRKQADLVPLQTEIARDVSSKLKTELSSADEAKVAKTYTTNPEAYQLYLKGNYHRTKFTEEGYKKGIEYYQKAIETDPNYALAYTGIAHAYVTATDWYLSPNEAMPKSKAAALKALELDNTLAQAYALLGANSFWYEWDWAAAEREIKHAIDLEPNDSKPHDMYGLYLGSMGRFDEAITEMKLAQRLGPLDVEANSNLMQVYYFAGQYEQAIEQSRKTVEIDQNHWYSWVMLGLAYERKGRFPEAIAEVQKAHSLDNNPWIMGYLGYVYAAVGKKAEARKVINELKELSRQRYVSPYSIAMIYAGLDDKDEAFEWLDKAYEARSGLAQLKVETVFDNLHSDPRFMDMLKRLNLTE